MHTLAEAINDFLKVDRSPTTTRNYTRTLNRMTEDIDSNLDLQAVTLSHLLHHINNLAVGTGGLPLKPSSLFSYKLTIKAFFNWCEKVDYLDHSPARKLYAHRPPPEVKDRGIPLEHARAILEEARKQPRDYALVLFMGETAARIGAVSRLCTTDLNLDDLSATFIEKGRKPVRVDYSPATAAALRDWLVLRGDVGHDYVWTFTTRSRKKLKLMGVTQILRRLSLLACGVEYSPHRWRHTVSERWEDLGIASYDIAHKLNHVDDAVTRRFYLRNRNPNVRQLSRKYPLAAFGGTLDTPTPGNIIPLDECV